MVQVTSHIVGFRSVLRVVNSIVLAVPIYSIFDLYAVREFRVEILTLRKRVPLRCCLYTPRRLQQTAVCNNIEDNKINS